MVFGGRVRIVTSIAEGVRPAVYTHDLPHFGWKNWCLGSVLIRVETTDPGGPIQIPRSCLPPVRPSSSGSRPVCAAVRVWWRRAEDFASDVRVALLEDNFAILRKFEKRSSLQSFLSVVIERLFYDQRTRALGRWFASAHAERHGAAADVAAAHRDARWDSERPPRVVGLRRRSRARARSRRAGRAVRPRHAHSAREAFARGPHAHPHAIRHLDDDRRDLESDAVTSATALPAHREAAAATPPRSRRRGIRWLDGGRAGRPAGNGDELRPGSRFAPGPLHFGRGRSSTGARREIVRSTRASLKKRTSSRRTLWSLDLLDD